MSYLSARNNLEREILTRLYPGPRNVTDLVEEISFLQKVSVQGVYKALRALKREEIVTIHSHTVSLSLIWVAKERDQLLFAEQSYQSAQYVDDLRTGKTKRARFSFRTLNEIDLFWTHTYLLLTNGMSTDAYSYSIQPHDWYMYVRYDTDAYWIKKHKENARISRTLLTHAGALDRAVIRMRKEQLRNLFEYTLGENPYNQDLCTYHNIIGSFIFTAEFDQSIAKRLDVFVNSHETLPLNLSEQKEIDAITSTKGKFILTIENSTQKAKKMREKVRKYFEF